MGLNGDGYGKGKGGGLTDEQAQEGDCGFLGCVFLFKSWVRFALLVTNKYIYLSSGCRSIVDTKYPSISSQDDNTIYIYRIEKLARRTGNKLTALTSPKSPHRAKCALRLAFELAPATPHSALITPAVLRTPTLPAFVPTSGDKQSRMMAASLNTSAASRYVLHSGSMAVPMRCAKRTVAIRPEESCRICRRRAEVGEAVASPTPTPIVVVNVLIRVF